MHPCDHLVHAMRRGGSGKWQRTRGTLQEPPQGFLLVEDADRMGVHRFFRGTRDAAYHIARQFQAVIDVFAQLFQPGVRCPDPMDRRKVRQVVTQRCQRFCWWCRAADPFHPLSHMGIVAAGKQIIKGEPDLGEDRPHLRHPDLERTAGAGLLQVRQQVRPAAGDSINRMRRRPAHDSTRPSIAAPHPMAASPKATDHSWPT